MLYWVFENTFTDPKDKYILVHSHMGNPKNYPEFSRFSPIYIEETGPLQGQATAILLAKEYINNDEELLIINSDQFVADPQVVDSMVKYFRENNADGGIMCFLADNPKWSFAKVKDGVVVETAEKNPISQNATVGIYYWKNGKDFVKYAEQMIKDDVRVNNEFYACPVFNYLIAQGGKVLPYMVNRMYGLGTPEDFEKNKDKIK